MYISIQFTNNMLIIFNIQSCRLSIWLERWVSVRTKVSAQEQYVGEYKRTDNGGGYIPHFFDRMYVQKNPIFTTFFGKIPGFFCRGDRKILTPEMDVINYSASNQIIIFSRTFSKKIR